VGLRAGLAVFALALLPAIAGDAVTNGPTKTDNNVRIVKKGTLGGEIKLYAVLTNCTEVTVTLKVTGDNVSLSRSVPFTVDSEGTNFLELVTLRATNPQRPWKYNSEFHWRPGRRGNVLTNSFAYHLPYAGETHRVVQADFGNFSHQAGSDNEHAIDWAMPVGTSIGAARDGTVVAIRQDSNVGGDDPKYKQSGNYVVIKHEDGTFAEYYHLKKDGVTVALGKRLRAGEPLGLSGDTGFRLSPHLHFVVFQNIDGQSRRSMPVVFETRTGEVESLKQGRVY